MIPMTMSWSGGTWGVPAGLLVLGKVVERDDLIDKKATSVSSRGAAEGVDCSGTADLFGVEGYWHMLMVLVAQKCR
jgi:hypothetical protein